MTIQLGHLFAQQLQTESAESSRVYEAMIGLVTDNKDPQKIGRVRVQIPNLSTADQTWWVPVVMLGAGKNRGWFFIPEPGDEVLLMFEHGDLDHPVVIGSLWNGKDKPADTNPSGNQRRVIKSRAGSRVVFDDDKLQIILEDGAGNGRITFDSGSNTITIEALQGDVCLQAPTGDMQIVAKAVELTATQNVEIYAGSSMAWGTDASGTIKGDAVTWSGAQVNDNNGTAQAPPMPEATPADVADPYGS